MCRPVRYDTLCQQTKENYRVSTSKDHIFRKHVLSLKFIEIMFVYSIESYSYTRYFTVQYKFKKDPIYRLRGRTWINLDFWSARPGALVNTVSKRNNIQTFSSQLRAAHVCITGGEAFPGWRYLYACRWTLDSWEFL